MNAPEGHDFLERIRLPSGRWLSYSIEARKRIGEAAFQRWLGDKTREDELTLSREYRLPTARDW